LRAVAAIGPMAEGAKRPECLPSRLSHEAAKDRKAFRRCCGSVDGDIDGYPALRAEKATEKTATVFLKTH
jgi:hypothetical protein